MTDPSVDTSDHARSSTLAELRKKERGTRALFQKLRKKFPLRAGMPVFLASDAFVPTEQRGETAAFAQATVAALEEATEEGYEARRRGEDTFVGPRLDIRNFWSRIEIIDSTPHEVEYAIVNTMAANVKDSDQRVRLFKRDHGPCSEIKLRLYCDTADRACNTQLLIAEEAALEKLADILEPIDYKQYLLTGTVHVFGKSGVIYIVRKGRPTLAYRKEDETRTNRRRYLGALCLHPLGYFSETWVGAMCPTDEAIAHILLIRCDEHYFWKRANVHPAGDIRGDF